MRYLLLLPLLLSCGDMPASDGSDATGTTAGVRLEKVATGLQSPVYLTSPAGDARMFVVEQPGRIRILQNGKVQDTPFLDIHDRLSFGGERGLLSVAFHPQFASNGFFYVDYTDRNGDTRIERYHAAPGAATADPGSAKLLLSIPQPYSNHNGGLVLFGPDGFLYIGMGDGGSAGDPQRNGGNPASRLGKILRLDVDHGDPYAIPPGNPYASGGGAAEVWALGVRNPWRFTFDPPSGLLIIADVGQNQYEEVDAQPASAPGLHYGWNTMEGAHCYQSVMCSKTGLVQPILEYGHGDGCSIAGGYVYRGSAMPDLVGTYFYSDYCRGWLRSFRIRGGQATEQREWEIPSIGTVLSFGRDAAGEIYMLAGDGSIYRLARAS